MKFTKKLFSLLIVAVISLTALSVPAAAASKKITVQATKIKSVSQTAPNSLKISWKKSTSASGYILYYKTAGESYKKIKTFSQNQTSYTHKSLKTNKTYFYKIKAYKISGGKKYYSNYSYTYKQKVIDPTPNRPEISSVTQLDTTTAKIKWSKVSDVDSYQLYCKTSGGSYKLIATLDSDTSSFKHRKLTPGKKYFYKVRACKTKWGKTYYGKWSYQQGKKMSNYLIDLIEPYNSSNYIKKASPDCFYMGGKKYTNGFCFNTHPYNWDARTATFNLSGKYSKISFILGNIDGTTGSYNFSIFADNCCVGTFTTNGTDLPKSYTVDIEEASKLEFRLGGRNGIGVANLKLYK